MEGLGVGVDKARDAWEIYMKFQVGTLHIIFGRNSDGGLKVWSYRPICLVLFHVGR